jgi:phosphopantothenoylcysteine decarboxylase/phosphopantothenate--cysteine ligase
MADDLASTVLLATRSPILLAPAMNTAMWQNPATKANCEILRARGLHFIGPEIGAMACDEEGPGRMSEAMDIFAAIVRLFAKGGPLAGKKALVTSGPTFEPLDPVRFLGNRSSGKQGHAIAKALAEAGADVTLVTGPVSLPDPSGLKTIHIETAREMLTASQEAMPCDIVVCAAAVADWRPEATSENKLKKGQAAPTIALTENPDILATLAKDQDRPARLVVGFAAETQNLLGYAEDKMARKGCDWIVANEVGLGKVFGQDKNQVTLLRRDVSGKIVPHKWQALSKDAVARRLVQEMQSYFKKESV